MADSHIRALSWDAARQIRIRRNLTLACIAGSLAYIAGSPVYIAVSSFAYIDGGATCIA